MITKTLIEMTKLNKEQNELILKLAGINSSVLFKNLNDIYDYEISLIKHAVDEDDLK